MGLLQILFGWPDGIVTGNLIASAMCWGLALLHLERRHRQLLARLEHRGGQLAGGGQAAVDGGQAHEDGGGG
jgi:hypothetical protein